MFRATWQITWALAWTNYEGPELNTAVDFLVEHRKQAKDPYLLSMLANGLVSADNLRHAGEMSQTTIAKWQKQFLESGREGLARGENHKTEQTRLQEELEERVDELTTALGEAYAELRVWRKKGGLYSPRTRS